MNKFLLVSIFVLIPLLSYAQTKFERITQADFDLKTYKKDTTAGAVVLYERGDFKFEVVSNSIFLIKNYTVKIKILNKMGFDEATISIPFYHNDTNSEKVYDIHGITNNGMVKTSLKKEDIYEFDNTENWSSKRFSMPNIKAGSIIQYVYKIRSPFFFNLDGWDFQSNIPKLYSEFNAEIPGNYFYNRALYGFLKLDIEETEIKKACFDIGGGYNPADCEILKYAMKDIPAFNEKEKFMLSPSNYKARLGFELAVYQGFDGNKRAYTKSWEDVDAEFRKDKDIGRQLSKNYFFKKNLPENLLNDGDELVRAQNIYKFVQNHFTWNGKYGIYKNIRVKDAFNAKTGNVGEINISLINLLKAAGIKTSLMLTATRERGLPKKSQPVITDFNYVIAKADIGEKTYLLDASSKTHPFGMLPFRCLNIYGRVMDFKQESYWQDIIPESENKIIVLGSCKLDAASKEIRGKFREINLGYNAVATYQTIISKTADEYLDFVENNSKNILIKDYFFDKEKSNEKKTVQSYEFVTENTASGDDILISPILMSFFKTNPFTRETRNFPVEFGYPREYEYSMVIEIPAEYEVKSLPKSKNIVLPNNAGLLQFLLSTSQNRITIRYQLDLNKTYFAPEAYSALKEFFKNAVEVEQNGLIILSRKV